MRPERATIRGRLIPAWLLGLALVWAGCGTKPISSTTGGGGGAGNAAGGKGGGGAAGNAAGGGGTLTGGGGFAGGATGGSGGSSGTTGLGGGGQGGALTGSDAGAERPADAGQGGSQAHAGDPCRGGDCSSQGPSFLVCVAPGAPTPDHSCPGLDRKCAQDSDCTADGGPTAICRPGVASMGCPSYCSTGCTSDAECGEGNACRADHHCVPQPCGTDAAASCPQDFACDGNACQRRSCTADSQCSVACVLGSCYDQFGSCTAAPL